MRKDCPHYGLFGLKLEILGSDTGTEAQIGVADKRGLLAVWSNPGSEPPAATAMPPPAVPTRSGSYARADG